MTYQLEMRDIICVKRLSAVLKPGCTLVTGPNSAGKTSVARTLAALSTHEGNPAGLAGPMTKHYVREGQKEGWASLDDVEWRPPAEFVNPSAAAPQSLPHCVGMVDFRRMPSTHPNRAKIFDGLSPRPDYRALLEPAWRQHGFSEKQLAYLLVKLESDKMTLDEVCEQYNQLRLEAGRRWCELTNHQRWSAKVAANWRPDEWSSDLEGVAESDVTAECVNADDNLRAVGEQAAIEQHEIDKAREVRDDKLPPLREKLGREEAALAEMAEKGEVLAEKAKVAQSRLAEKRGLLESASQAVKAAEKALDEAEGSAYEKLSCPSCAAEMALRDGSLVLVAELEGKHEQVVAAARAKLGKCMDVEAAESDGAGLLGSEARKAAEAVDGSRQAYAAKQGEINQLKGQVAELEGQAALADAEARESNAAELSQLENERAKAYLRLDAWKKVRDANHARDEYFLNEAIAKLLGPGGIRAKAGAPFLTNVRKCLSSIGRATDWPEIRLDDHLQLTIGGFAVQLASESEKARVQWAMQVAVAMCRPDVKIVVLDACDVLRGAAWDGLVKLCDLLAAKNEPRDGKPARANPLHIIVCATETETPEGWHEVVVA